MNSITISINTSSSKHLFITFLLKKLSIFIKTILPNLYLHQISLKKLKDSFMTKYNWIICHIQTMKRSRGKRWWNFYTSLKTKTYHLSPDPDTMGSGQVIVSTSTPRHGQHFLSHFKRCGTKTDKFHIQQFYQVYDL